MESLDKEYTTSHQMGKYPNFVIALMLGFFPLLGVVLSFAAIYVLYSMYVVDGYSIAYSLAFFVYILVVAVMCYIIGWVLIAQGLARYTFADTGLVVKYPLRNTITIPWDDFQQVCICYAAYTATIPCRANTVICLVKQGERRNALGRWKTDNPFRYRSVICIDFRNSLWNGLTEKYPGTVVDLRDTPEYRLMR